MNERKRILTALMLMGALTLSACGANKEMSNTSGSSATTATEDNNNANTENANKMEAEETAEDNADSEDHGDDLGEPSVTILSVDDAFAKTSGEPFHIAEYFDAQVGTWTYQIDDSGSDALVDDYEYAKLGDTEFLDGDYFDTDDIVDPTDIVDTNNLNEDEYDSYFADYHRDANRNTDFMTLMDSNSKKRCVLISITNWNEITVYLREHLGTIYADGEPRYYLSRSYSMKYDWLKGEDPQEFIDAVKNTLGVEIQLDWIYEN